MVMPRILSDMCLRVALCDGYLGWAGTEAASSVDGTGSCKARYC
jgi:hypothetical protein